MKRLSLIAPLALTGCAAGGFSYTKTGVTQQQLDKDESECRKEAQRTTIATPGHPVAPSGGAYRVAAGTYVDKEKAKECLKARGYTITNN